jgi:hypothetical protein
MGTLVATEFLTLDGVMETSRLFAGDEGMKAFALAEARQAGECVILTYRRDQERRAA